MTSPTNSPAPDSEWLEQLVTKYLASKDDTGWWVYGTTVDVDGFIAEVTAKLAEARIVGIEEAHKAIMEYAYAYTGEDGMADFCGVDDLSRVAMSWKVDRITALRSVAAGGE